MHFRFGRSNLQRRRDGWRSRSWLRCCNMCVIIASTVTVCTESPADGESIDDIEAADGHPISPAEAVSTAMSGIELYRLVSPDRRNNRDLPTRFCRSGHFLLCRKLGTSRSIRWISTSDDIFCTASDVFLFEHYFETFRWWCITPRIMVNTYFLLSEHLPNYFSRHYLIGILYNIHDNIDSIIISHCIQ